MLVAGSNRTLLGIRLEVSSRALLTICVWFPGGLTSVKYPVHTGFGVRQTEVQIPAQPHPEHREVSEGTFGSLSHASAKRSK